MAEQSSQNAAMMRTLSALLRRVPLLVPLVVVACAIEPGSSVSWALAAVALTLANVAGQRHILACSVLCAAVVFCCNLLRQREQEALEQTLAQHGMVSLNATVVHELSKGCVLQTGWLGLRVAVRGEGAEWRVGDEVHVIAQASDKPPATPLVPGMFSQEVWMRGQGIYANLEYRYGEKTGDSYGWYRLVRMASAVRDSLATRLMPPGTEGDMRRQVLCALVLGEKSRAEKDTIELFRRGGCLHAFAVSGLHVGLVYGIFALLLRVCRVRPVVGRYVLLAVVGLYVLATGLAVPALRAYLMLAAFLSGLILRRRSSLFNTWCFAALVILMLEPWQLYQPGFQLSFAIYGAICLGVRFCMGRGSWFGPNSYIPVRIHTRSERFLRRFDFAVRGVIIVSLSAWLAALPLSVAHFHAVNTFGYFVNILISPLLPPVMLFGLLTLFFGGLPLLGPLCHWLATTCAGWLISLVSLVGVFPGSFLPAIRPQPPPAAMVACSAYNQSFAILGNPGLLIGDVKRESQARYVIEPALFHAGYRPAAVFDASEASLAVYRRSWPGLLVLPQQSAVSPLTFSTAAGQFSLYYPPPELPRSPQPVVVWQSAAGLRVVYIGNAAATTVESLPPQERRADILILGYNAAEPVPTHDMLSVFGAAELVLLPNYPSDTTPALPQPFKLRRLSPGEAPLFTLP